MRKTKIALTAFALSLSATMLLSSCGDGDKTGSTEQPASEHRAGDGHDHSHDTTTTGQASDNAMMKVMSDMMSRMDKMQMTGDFDHDFAVMMIDHHQGAIDMAQLEVQSGKDEKIKSMAQNIITAQKAEQEKLRAFVSGHTPKPDKGHSHGDGDAHHTHNELQEAMHKMMDQMKGMQMTGDTDKDFVMMMIPHHQSAVDMAKNELSHGKEVEIKKMAQKMIADQNKEMKELQAWLDSHK